MRLLKILPLVLITLVAGCDREDISSCEDYIKYKLKSPSSYNRVKITEFTGDVTTQDQLEKELKLPKPSSDLEYELRRLWHEEGSISSVSMREIAIQYDAQNEFGSNVRRVDVCRFRLLDGKLPNADELRQLVNAANQRTMKIEISKITGKLDGREWKPESRCCIAQY